MDETLFSEIIKATGLPTELVNQRLKSLLLNRGTSPQAMTLEDLREVLIPLMQNLFCEVASGENEFIKISD